MRIVLGGFMALSSQISSESENQLLLDFVDEVEHLSSKILKTFDEATCEFKESNTLPVNKVHKIKKSLAAIKETAGFFNLKEIEKISGQIDDRFNLWLDNQLSHEEILGIEKSIKLLDKYLLEIKTVEDVISKSFDENFLASRTKEEDLLNNNFWINPNENQKEDHKSHVSMDQLMSSFYSFVEVLSKQFDKEVKLYIQSDVDYIKSDFAFDLTSIIVPVVRNSIEHGIEHANEREKIKKSAQGLIKVIMAKTSDGLNLTIFDDGQGIDVERMTQGTKLRDLISEANVHSLSKEDKNNLILIKEMSQNYSQNSIGSKQGSGFDAIRRVMNKYDGTYEVFSKFNQGTLFEFVFKGQI